MTNVAGVAELADAQVLGAAFWHFSILLILLVKHAKTLANIG